MYGVDRRYAQVDVHWGDINPSLFLIVHADPAILVISLILVLREDFNLIAALKHHHAFPRRSAHSALYP